MEELSDRLAKVLHGRPLFCSGQYHRVEELSNLPVHTSAFLCTRFREGIVCFTGKMTSAHNVVNGTVFSLEIRRPPPPPPRSLNLLDECAVRWCNGSLHTSLQEWALRGACIALVQDPPVAPRRRSSLQVLDPSPRTDASRAVSRVRAVLPQLLEWMPTSSIRTLELFFQYIGGHSDIAPHALTEEAARLRSRDWLQLLSSSSSSSFSRYEAVVNCAPQRKGDFRKDPDRVPVLPPALSTRRIVCLESLGFVTLPRCPGSIVAAIALAREHFITRNAIRSAPLLFFLCPPIHLPDH